METNAGLRAVLSSDLMLIGSYLFIFIFTYVHTYIPTYLYFGSGERKPTQGPQSAIRIYFHMHDSSSRGLAFLNHQGCPGVAHFHIILHESLLYLLRQEDIRRDFAMIEAR